MQLKNAVRRVKSAMMYTVWLMLTRRLLTTAGSPRVTATVETKLIYGIDNTWQERLQ